MHKDDKNRLKNIKSDIFLGFLGLVFLIVQIFIIRITDINLWLVIGAFISIGFVATLFDFKRYTFVYEFSNLWARIFCFFQNTLIWGSILGLFFFGANYLFEDNRQKRNKYEIIKVTYAIGPKTLKNGRKSAAVTSERRPVFTVLYKGIEKDFEFSSRYYENRYEYGHVLRVTTTGLFGFDIIKSDTPIN